MASLVQGALSAMEWLRNSFVEWVEKPARKADAMIEEIKSSRTMLLIFGKGKEDYFYSPQFFLEFFRYLANYLDRDMRSALLTMFRKGVHIHVHMKYRPMCDIHTLTVYYPSGMTAKTVSEKIGFLGDYASEIRYEPLSTRTI